MSFLISMIIAFFGCLIGVPIALGVVKALSRDMNETRGKQERGTKLFDRFKNMF